MIRRALLLLLVAASSLRADVPSQRVGQPLLIPEIFVAGDEVTAKPRRDREPPLVVRVLEVKPAKNGSRYDFEVHGLEPGNYDLADFLDAPAGTVLPAIPLEITSGLDPGVLETHPLATTELPTLGGYRTMLLVAAAIWVAGLVAILAWRRNRPAAKNLGATAPATVAERLRPLVKAAAEGKLDDDDRAKLERLVIGHWRSAFPRIAALSPAEAMVELRQHPESAPLILALERWLHARPGEAPPTDIERLLAPYA